MTDDTWIRELARVAKEEQEGEAVLLDERWDRLSRGDLPESEDAELRALASSSEDAREAYELFRPFSAATQARMLAALDRQGRNILPFPKPSTRVAGVLSTAAAVAAAALVLVLRSPTPSGPFPPYKAHWEGEVKTERGGSQETQGNQETLIFRRDGNLKLILKSAGEGVDQVDAGCYFVREKVAEPCAPGTLRIDSKTGTVVIHGSVGDELHLAPGESELCVLVGFKGRLPEPQEQAKMCAGGTPKGPPGAGYQIFHQPLKVAA